MRSWIFLLWVGVIFMTVSTRVEAEVSFRQLIPLSGDWKIQPATSPESLPIEANWKTGGYGNWNGSGKEIHSLWYEKTFAVPGPDKKGRVIVDFRAIAGDAIIFLNGARVSELLRPGGEVDVTDQVRWGGENVLRVFVTRDYTGISRKFEADLYRYLIRSKAEGKNGLRPSEWGLGITAPVTVEIRPPTAIVDVFCIPSWRAHTLTLEVALESSTAAKGRLEAEIVNAKGETVLRLQGTSREIPRGRSVQRIFAEWKDPVCWELDRPYLYTARVRLHADAVEDAYPDVSFGFREVWTEGRTLVMNGHPSRWRITDLYGANKYALSFYRLMGFNVGQIQPHGKLWGGRSDTPVFDDGLLSEADRLGMGISLPAPSINSLGSDLLKRPEVREAYAREMEYHVKQYRNHPSILAWAVGMNTYNPRSNIHPATLGLREEKPPEKGAIVEIACEIGRKLDATRLFYSHADGSVGDVSTANVYLNFVPLQEREEWPMAWAATGNMPYGAVEFGPPFTANFWKGKQFFLTEYLAIYFGEEAYNREGEAGLIQTVETGLANTNKFGAWRKVNLEQYPLYWEFERLFTTNTNRSWRTWGVNAGWLHWNLDMGYGTPPGATDHFTQRYRTLTEPVAAKPAWANPFFDINHSANDPLLVYLAGAPVPTDKTHAFYSGETIRKQVAAVWDGAENRRLTVNWALRQGTEVKAKSTSSLSLKPGEIQLQPFTVVAPEVRERTPMTLELEVMENGKLLSGDRMNLEIFPRLKPQPIEARVAVYDPQGKSSSWVKALGVEVAKWAPGDSLNSLDLLIIGREAIKSGDKMPYSAEDLARGLRVLILEQQPVVWEQLGFQTSEAMPRYVFARDQCSPILNGILPEDLTNWRGAPDLLPEGKWAKVYDVQHAPKWTNRHAVASVVLKIPECVGFTPILQAEFDLAYSPLVEWRYGKGAIYFSSLDFTGRVGVDPAATQLAGNLLRSISLKETRKSFYVGDAAGKQGLEALQVGVEKDAPKVESAAKSLLIVGDIQKADRGFLEKYASQGGVVFCIMQKPETLNAWGFETQSKSFSRVSVSPKEAADPLLRSIGVGVLRWRDKLTVDVFSPAQPDGCRVLLDGLLLEKKIGSGRFVFLQAGPQLLADRYAGDLDKQQAIQLSVVRLRQLVSQVITNLGASASDAMARRFTYVARPPSYYTIKSWRVLGPFEPKERDAKVALDQIQPGESDAIEGGENPNLTYSLPNGRVLDWRLVVNADEDGFVNLGKALHAGEGSLAYATTTISSEKKKMVRLSFGADYWAKVWLNGRLLQSVATVHGPPQARAFVVEVLLSKGDNTLTFKVGSGDKGFGFWAEIMEMPDVAQSQMNTGKAEVPLNFYSPLKVWFDPYEFFYW